MVCLLVGRWVIVEPLYHWLACWGSGLGAIVCSIRNAPHKAYEFCFVEHLCYAVRCRLFGTGDKMNVDAIF